MLDYIMDMQSNQTRLIDIETLYRCQEVIMETLGKNWIKKKIKEEKIAISKDQSSVGDRKHSYLYRAKPHPLISILIEAEKWAINTLRTKEFQLNESVLRLYSFGTALDVAKNQVGFNRLVDRLKKKEQFYSTAFEVEVAASYLMRGYKVEFIEENSTKTPDLKVTIPNGITFFAECKCRDQLTERDQLVDCAWNDLEASLIRELGPRKINAAIIIKAITDPTREDAKGLLTFVLDLLEQCKKSKITHLKNLFVSNHNHTRQYEVEVIKLTLEDEEIESNGLTFVSPEKLDRELMTCEMRIDEARLFLLNFV